MTVTRTTFPGMMKILWKMSLSWISLSMKPMSTVKRLQGPLLKILLSQQNSSGILPMLSGIAAFLEPQFKL